jgi:Family of unknown function (DUF6281)
MRARAIRSSQVLVMAVLVVAAAAITIAIFGQWGREQNPSGSAGPAAGACAAAVEWQGTTYFGTKLQRAVTVDRSLGNGTLPACVDTNTPGDSGTPARSVSLVAVAEVPSRQAVAVAGDSSLLYVAPEYFTQLPKTALHDVLYGPSADLPNERGNDCKGASTQEIRVTVQSANFGMLHVTLPASANLPRENWIFPDARTVIVGGGAEPRVRPGDVVRAQVLVCRHRDDPHFLKLVATRLSLGRA